MKPTMTVKCGILSSALLCGSFAWATDYYVSTTGVDSNDGLTAETAFATIDKAVSTAASADTIYVAAGTYTTTTQWGPNLAATMVGLGNTRNDVVIESAGSYRTLRTASTAVVSNLTIVGNTAWKADKGGAVEMSGGTIEDCVIRGGTAYANNNLAGGNLYMSGGAIVTDCDIIGGSATNRGGNVHIIGGSVLNCTITGGKTEGSGGIGGNLFVNGSSVVVSNCVIQGGSVDARGGNVFLLAGTLKDCQIKDGEVSVGGEYLGGGNVYVQAGTLTRCSITGGSITSGNERGGGVMVKSTGSSIVIEDCLIANNTQGAIYAVDKITEIYNSTIVNNTGYGVYGYGNYPKSFVNNILFGNYAADGTTLKSWAGDKSREFYALGSEDTNLGKSATDYVEMTGDDFENYAEGNYQLSSSSALIDKGRTDTRANVSVLDLLGAPRVVGQVDIGCYEYQKPEMSVSFAVGEGFDTHGKISFSTTFKSQVVNSTGTVTYSYDFGDGTPVESTQESQITHEYTMPGVYSVKMTATDGSSEAAYEIADYIRVVGDKLFVVAGNKSAAYPYDTEANAAATISAAYDAAETGCEIVLASGIHETSVQVDVTKAVAITGKSGKPEDVIVRNTKTAASNSQYYRCFQVNNADARIFGLTMENGSVFNNNGAVLRVAQGMVSNCVIRGGRAVVSGNGPAAGGGVELSGSGILTHCVVSNNVVEGTSANTGLAAGGGVFFSNGAKSAKLLNCLIAYNRYIPTTTAEGAAGVRYGGSNDNSLMENCTIVSNVVEGALKDDSAGLYCTSWYTPMRNNVIAGNYETEKKACTSMLLGYASGGPIKAYAFVVGESVTDAGTQNYSEAVTLGDKEAMFKNFEGGDFTPKPGNALANKGATPSYVAAVDLAGNPRVFGKAIDIGCYEVQRNSGFIVRIR